MVYGVCVYVSGACVCVWCVCVCVCAFVCACVCVYVSGVKRSVWYGVWCMVMVVMVVMVVSQKPP